MSDALGLSVGTTNLVAARLGRQPVTRRSVLTMWHDHPAELGTPAQNPELTNPDLTRTGMTVRDGLILSSCSILIFREHLWGPSPPQTLPINWTPLEWLIVGELN